MHGDPPGPELAGMRFGLQDPLSASERRVVAGVHRGLVQPPAGDFIPRWGTCPRRRLKQEVDHWRPKMRLDLGSYEKGGATDSTQRPLMRDIQCVRRFGRTPARQSRGLTSEG